MTFLQELREITKKSEEGVSAAVQYHFISILPEIKQKLRRAAAQHKNGCSVYLYELEVFSKIDEATQNAVIALIEKWAKKEGMGTSVYGSPFSAHTVFFKWSRY